MSENLSIKQIAELAGVSVATISRVINQNGGYSSETESRVKQVIEEHNYIPNSVAKGLRTSKTPTIGIIVPDIANEYYAKLVLDLQIELFEYNYLTMVCNVNESTDLERKHIRALASQNVSGLILISVTNGHMDLQNIPTVYFDRRPSYEAKRNSQVFVESDNCQGGYLATKELINKGCKRIAFITDILGQSSKIDRYEGYCKALTEFGLLIDPTMVMNIRTVSIDEAFKITAQNMEIGLKFDGIVCTTDLIAIGAILAVKSYGKKVPEDIMVTGFDDISITNIFEPSVTTIHQYGDKMAKLAAELMMDLINGRPIKNKHCIMPVKLVERQSTKLVKE